MRKLLLATVLTLSLSGCFGDTSINNELTGQVKRVHTNTPLICSNFNDVDVSLGIMRNGIGSMSTNDEWLYVPNEVDFKLLSDAAANGTIVKITYDEARATFCVENYKVTHVELVK